MMRRLVLEQISEIWDEHTTEQFKMTFEEVSAKDDFEVLGIYEELIGFNG
jgi:hypothetical protein